MVDRFKPADGSRVTQSESLSAAEKATGAPVKQAGKSFGKDVFEDAPTHLIQSEPPQYLIPELQKFLKVASPEALRQFLDMKGFSAKELAKHDDSYLRALQKVVENLKAQRSRGVVSSLSKWGITKGLTKGTLESKLDDTLQNIQEARTLKSSLNSRLQSHIRTVSAGYFYNDALKEIESLLKDGADPNTAEPTEGHTHLLSASTWDGAADFQLLLTLIRKGANVNLANKYGETPLHKAQVLGNTRATELLIAAGADVNATNSHGQTPLHQAARFDPKGIEALLNAGADPSIRDQDGKTALDLAEKDEAKKALTKHISAEGLLDPAELQKQIEARLQSLKSASMPKTEAEEKDAANGEELMPSPSSADPREDTNPNDEIALLEARLLALRLPSTPLSAPSKNDQAAQGKRQAMALPANSATKTKS